MNDVLNGRILNEVVQEDGLLVTVEVFVKDKDRYLKQRPDVVMCEFRDGRMISASQRKKACALIREIADWMGESDEYVSKHMKVNFLLTKPEMLDKTVFSLKNCSMETARDFIEYLIEFVVKNDVPCQKVRPNEICDDVDAYIYTCLMSKRCAVCGSKADLHHVDRVGMGHNRDEIIHEGLEVMPLCRKHHTECHTMSQADFNERYHLNGMKADKDICKVYGLKAGKERTE